MKAVTRELSSYCCKTTFDDLSPEAIEAVKRLTWDFLGVSIRGVEAPSSRPVLRFIEELNIRGSSTLLGSGLRTQPQYAALGNGTFIKGNELDDISNEASSHIGAAVFPVALALGEELCADGRKFIEAVTLGYEAMVRIGRAIGPREHYAHGFHPSGTCGTFGAAVAAAKLLGLGVDEMIYALGIAGSQAAGLQEFIFEGAWTKAIHSGWAAHNGILAAQLARHGFRGPTTVLEGPFGFLHSYSHGGNPELVLEGIGSGFKITRIGIKRHSTCRYEHGAIDAILEMVQAHHIKSTDVREVEIRLVQAAMPIIAEPAEVKYHPKTPMDAMHSMPYGAAVVLARGQASIEEHELGVIGSADVQALLPRVRCVQDPELERDFPARWPTVVRIETVAGQVFERRKEHPHGDAEDPMSWDEIRAKVEHLIVGRVTNQVCLALEGLLRDLEDLSDINDLTRILHLERH